MFQKPHVKLKRDPTHQFCKNVICWIVGFAKKSIHRNSFENQLKFCGPKKFFFKIFFCIWSQMFPSGLVRFDNIVGWIWGIESPPWSYGRFQRAIFVKIVFLRVKCQPFWCPKRGLKYSEKIKMFQFFSSLLLGYFPKGLVTFGICFGWFWCIKSPM